MAPNRKTIFGLFQSSSTTTSNDILKVQTKFLPLTNAEEEPEHLQRFDRATKVQSEEGSASQHYWNCSVDTEATTGGVLSLSSIEANLIKDANETSSSDTESPSRQVASHDEYWAESEQQQQQVMEEDKSTKSPQHINNEDGSSSHYWDWTVDHQETDSYWQWESAKVAPHIVDPTSHPETVNYWDWNTQESIRDELESDVAREFFMAANIVLHLLAHAASSMDSSFGNKSSSDAYWNFAEHYGDSYWQSTTAKMIASTGSEGYWDE